MIYRSLNFHVPTDPPRYLRTSVVFSILIPKNTIQFYLKHTAQHVARFLLSWEQLSFRSISVRTLHGFLRSRKFPAAEKSSTKAVTLTLTLYSLTLY